MSFRKSPMVLIAAIVGACTSNFSGSSDDPRIIKNLPEEVVNIAAPFQNLQAVRLQDDGCYWYRHEGPVEATFLPLRTSQGRTICVKKADA